MTPPHRVSKLYYLVLDERAWAVYQSAFKKLTTRVDGEERTVTPWPRWAVSAEIDTYAHWRSAWSAVRRHETQLSAYARLDEVTPAQHEALWGSATFYRALSTVNGGRSRETDLFDGVAE